MTNINESLPAPRPRVALRRMLTVLGSLLLAAIIAGGAFSMLATAAKYSFDVRASYTNVNSLRLDSDGGDVHLSAAPAGSPLKVAEHVTESFSRAHPHASRSSDGVLTLNGACSTHYADCSVDYTISVPAGVAVDVASGNGDIDARGLTAVNSLTLRSGNGSVDAFQIAAPDVLLESGNGDVTATLSDASVRLIASSGNGSVTVTVPDTTYAVSARAGNGTVSDRTLRIDPNSPRQIVASSGNGDVTIRAAGASSG